MDIKRGTTPTIKLAFDGLNYAEVRTIDVIIKQKLDETSPELLRKQFPTDGYQENGILSIPLTSMETRWLPVGTIYIDTRITMLDGTIPTTDIVRAESTQTLFGEDDSM